MGEALIRVYSNDIEKQEGRTPRKRVLTPASKRPAATSGMTGMGNFKKRHGNKGNAPAQDEVLAYIAAMQADHKRVPTIEEIRVHMGWKARGAVFDVLCKLVYNNRLDELILAAIMATTSTQRLPVWWRARSGQLGVIR